MIVKFMNQFELTESLHNIVHHPGDVLVLRTFFLINILHYL